jgi:hypothetical protein
MANEATADTNVLSSVGEAQERATAPRRRNTRTVEVNEREEVNETDVADAAEDGEPNYVIRSRRADRKIGEVGRTGERVELPPAPGSVEEVEAAREQDEENMGKITGVNPYSGLEFRDGVDPVSGARQPGY